MGCGRECGKAQRSCGAARLSGHMVAQSGFTAFFSTLAFIQAGGPLTSRWRLALSLVGGAAQEASTPFS
jgi:hypothetical protein